MTREEKYQKWLQIAEYDLDTADAMLKSGRYLYVAFMCQQAIEKLAKGIYVYTFDKEAKYTHNILLVLEDMKNITKSKKYEEYKTLFSELTAYYIVGRYDAYKQDLAKEINNKSAEKIINQTKEAFTWLKSQVTL